MPDNKATKKTSKKIIISYEIKALYKVTFGLNKL